MCSKDCPRLQGLGLGAHGKGVNWATRRAVWVSARPSGLGVPHPAGPLGDNGHLLSEESKTLNGLHRPLQLCKEHEQRKFGEM